MMHVCLLGGVKVGDLFETTWKLRWSILRGKIISQVDCYARFVTGEGERGWEDI